MAGRSRVLPLRSDSRPWAASSSNRPTSTWFGVHVKKIARNLVAQHLSGLASDPPARQQVTQARDV